jgi:hypothetical protein
VNENNLSIVRQEASRHFRNKKREYMKNKLTSLDQTVRVRTSEISIKKIKKVYHLRTNLLKDEKCDLADAPYLLTPWHYSPDGHKPPLTWFHSLI